MFGKKPVKNEYDETLRMVLDKRAKNIQSIIGACTAIKRKRSALNALQGHYYDIEMKDIAAQKNKLQILLQAGEEIDKEAHEYFRAYKGKFTSITGIAPVDYLHIVEHAMED